MSLTQHTQTPQLTQKDRAKILSTIKKLVPERHINVSNANQDYGQWLSLVNERMPRLIALNNPEAFEAGVGELLKALGSSHTAFFHQRRDKIPAPYSINATLRAVETSNGKRWMFVDVIEHNLQIFALVAAIRLKSALSTGLSAKSLSRCRTGQQRIGHP